MKHLRTLPLPALLTLAALVDALARGWRWP
jgi:hypothetical protein